MGRRMDYGLSGMKMAKKNQRVSIKKIRRKMLGPFGMMMAIKNQKALMKMGNLMVNGQSGMSGFGEMRLNILQEKMMHLIRPGTLMGKYLQQKTGTAVKKMVFGLGGIKMVILTVQGNM